MTSCEAKLPAVFLDRDGTLIHDADYCSDPKQVRVFKGASETLGRLKKRGYKIIWKDVYHGHQRRVFYRMAK